MNQQINLKAILKENEKSTKTLLLIFFCIANSNSKIKQKQKYTRNKKEHLSYLKSND